MTVFELRSYVARAPAGSATPQVRHIPAYRSRMTLVPAAVSSVGVAMQS
ncbi:hypothetical protein [Cellulomonas fengjieae]|nr:hypothetical protein [Cellulomonas fengjieae]